MRSLVAATLLVPFALSVHVLEEDLFTDDALSLLQVARTGVTKTELPGRVPRGGFIEESAEVDDENEESLEESAALDDEYEYFLEESAAVANFPKFVPGTLYECGFDLEHYLSGPSNTEQMALQWCGDLPPCQGVVNQGGQWYLMNSGVAGLRTWKNGPQLPVKVKVTHQPPPYLDSSITDVSDRGAPTFSHEAGAIFACEHHPRCRGYWVDPNCNFKLLLYSRGPGSFEFRPGFPYGPVVKAVKKKGSPSDSAPSYTEGIATGVNIARRPVLRSESQAQNACTHSGSCKGIVRDRRGMYRMLVPGPRTWKRGQRGPGGPATSVKVKVAPNTAAGAPVPFCR